MDMCFSPGSISFPFFFVPGGGGGVRSFSVSWVVNLVQITCAVRIS